MAADAASTLPGLSVPGLTRTVSTPDFEGITFHEILCRSALNRAPESSRLPFRWTINPIRGCSHACTYCFARPTHEYLDLDPGHGFDSQLIVKTNIVPVLERELSRRSWRHERVSLGTNTDPYQRAEGRYRLMPGIIRALAGSGTPFSVLTKGTLLRRDLPLLVQAARTVDVSIGVSLAHLDEDLHVTVEPGAPGPRARLDLIRAVRDAGFACHVMIAPVLPYITDSRSQLSTIIGGVAEAGATRVTVLPLELRGSTRDWYLAWLADDHPRLLPRYRQLYGAGSSVPASYRRWLTERITPLLAEFDLTGSPDRGESAAPVSAATERDSVRVRESQMALF